MINHCNSDKAKKDEVVKKRKKKKEKGATYGVRAYTFLNRQVSVRHTCESEVIAEGNRPLLSYGQTC